MDPRIRAAQLKDLRAKKKARKAKERARKLAVRAAKAAAARKPLSMSQVKSRRVRQKNTSQTMTGKGCILKYGMPPFYSKSGPRRYWKRVWVCPGGSIFNSAGAAVCGYACQKAKKMDKIKKLLEDRRRRKRERRKKLGGGRRKRKCRKNPSLPGC
mgnify:FL=1